MECSRIIFEGIQTNLGAFSITQRNKEEGSFVDRFMISFHRLVVQSFSETLHIMQYLL